MRVELGDGSGLAPIAAAGFSVPTAPATDCLLADGTTGACGSGGAGLQQSIVTDLKGVLTSGTRLDFGAGRCSGGTKVASFAVITAGAGNGSWVSYCTPSQAVVVSHSTSAGLTVTCTNCLQIQETTPAVPAGMFAIATGAIAGGAWSSLADQRDFSVRLVPQNGPGSNSTLVGGTYTDSVDGTVVQFKADPLTPTNTVDMSGAISTKPTKSATTLPGTCSVAEMFFDIDAAAGSQLYVCSATNIWSLVGGGSYRVAYALPFSSFEATGGTGRLLWNFTGSMVIGRDTGDGVCPATSALGLCGVRWLNLTDGVQVWATTTILLPTGWTSGNVTFQLVLGSGFSSFTPTFQVRTACVSNAAAPPAYNASQTLAPAMVSGNVYTPSLNLTTTGCAAGRPMVIQLTRSDVGVANQIATVVAASVEVAVP